MRNFTSPAVALLSVFISVPLAAQSPGFQSSGGNTTTSDKVGVGTTTPATSLHVATESTAGTRGLLVQQSNTGTSSPFIILRKSRGTILAPQAVTFGDATGLLFSEGYDGTTYLRTGGSIRFTTDGTVAPGSVPTGLAFSTGGSFTGNTERMRISSTGHVGIGVQIPVLPLQIAGTSVLNGAARRNVTVFDLDPSAQGVGGGIALGGNYSAVGAATEFANIWGIKENAMDNDNAGALLFATHPNNAPPAERLRIGSDGLVLHSLSSITPRAEGM